MLVEKSPARETKLSLAATFHIFKRRINDTAFCSEKIHNSVLACKAICNLLLCLLFPLRNLIWMHAILAGKLGQGLLPRQGIKGDAGLEFGGELPSRIGHKKPPLTFYVHLSSRSSFPNPLLFDIRHEIYC